MRPKSTSGNYTAHRATSLSARELALWLPPATSADSNLIPELGALVSRSRDLVRNHGVASGCISNPDGYGSPKLYNRHKDLSVIDFARSAPFWRATAPPEGRGQPEVSIGPGSRRARVPIMPQ